jgi:hypothetical protein
VQRQKNHLPCKTHKEGAPVQGAVTARARNRHGAPPLTDYTPACIDAASVLPVPACCSCLSGHFQLPHFPTAAVALCCCNCPPSCYCCCYNTDPPTPAVCIHPGLFQQHLPCPPASCTREEGLQPGGTRHAGCTAHSGRPRPTTAGVHPSPTLLFALPPHLPAVILSRPPAAAAAAVPAVLAVVPPPISWHTFWVTPAPQPPPMVVPVVAQPALTWPGWLVCTWRCHHQNHIKLVP